MTLVATEGFGQGNDMVRLTVKKDRVCQEVATARAEKQGDQLEGEFDVAGERLQWLE